MSLFPKNVEYPFSNKHHLLVELQYSCIVKRFSKTFIRTTEQDMYYLTKTLLNNNTVFQKIEKANN